MGGFTDVAMAVPPGKHSGFLVTSAWRALRARSGDYAGQWRLALDAEALAAWNEKKSEYIPLLRDAIPAFEGQEKPRSILAPKETSDQTGQKFEFSTKDLAGIPDELHSSARALPDNGGYRLEGDGAMLKKLESHWKGSTPPAGMLRISGAAEGSGSGGNGNGGGDKFTITREQANDFSFIVRSRQRPRRRARPSGFLGSGLRGRAVAERC
jgi:hypothetical protein